ncbi:phage tail sheath subtilisin-like domain-containing protein [Nitrospirillum sp. BR 11164]|uniref:phage tail sheath family protein n=1 Tax=Nitrospirillum sp. BR 11164 TaxID=3104324 RepID=UPI002B001A66|nr:phage tail sheath C-terminal domain-containing protein [Nitrospirillum sp. BR 11164]MEA1648355.1 phage tail sheath subtilisin-like domain-containing protein [Nitrospirillum sp. BR 11164]
MPNLINRATPGVYLTESSAFPTSIIGVQTAVPVFIGYTEYARDPVSQKPLSGQAVAISALADYTACFGGAYAQPFQVTPAKTGPADFQATQPNGQGTASYTVDPSGPRFNLAQAIQAFYANGGGACYVVSVADYGAGRVAKDTLLAGLQAAGAQAGPTMTVVPDACLLPDADYAVVVTAMLTQAGTLGDRMAILDLPGATSPTGGTVDGLAAQRDAFYTAIVPAVDAFSYGAAYAPALHTNLTPEGEVDYTRLQGSAALMRELLGQQASALYTGAQLAEVQARLATAFPAVPPTPAPSPSEISTTNQYLLNALPLLAQIEGIMARKLNVAPPSGIMAGVWAQNDANRGVWNAPANLTLNGVVAPTVTLTDAQQGDYNLPLNGNAINILRAFINRGTVPWGARTLDGNSNDYRYIQVRRTLIYIEQSIKTALQQFVFAANDGQTWVTVTSMISTFLTGLWSQGGLLGDKASDAFSVQCGLGSTMTAQDILNGYMIVSVTLQMVHPGEFIELTFTQKMQGIG